MLEDVEANRSDSLIEVTFLSKIYISEEYKPSYLFDLYVLICMSRPWTRVRFPLRIIDKRTYVEMLVPFYLDGDAGGIELATKELMKLVNFFQR